MSRRGRRLNRRGLATAAATAAAVLPPNLTGVLLELWAESGTTADRSGQGNTVTEVGGAPVIGASARCAGATSINFTVGKCLQVTGPVVTHRVGADKPWTQVLIQRPTTVGAAQQLMGWTRQGGASDLVHLTYAEVSGSRRYRNILRADAGGAGATVDSTAQWDAAPEMLFVICDGTSIAYYVNNVAAGPTVPAQNQGTFTPTEYDVMCRNAFSGLNATGSGDLLYKATVDHAIDSTERGLLAQFAFDKYGMGASGATGPTQKVGILIGQSNGRLAGTTTLTNGSKVRAYSLDNFWRLNPTSSQNDAAAVYTGVFNEAQGASVNWGLFACDAMAGDTGLSYGLITNAKGSTGTGGAAGPASATNWFPSTLTSTLYGAAMATIGRAALISGATPLFALIDIGEEDSKAGASTWTLANIKTDLRTKYPGIILIVRQLRATNPNVGTYPSWDGTVALQAAEHNPGDGVYVIASPDDAGSYSDGVHMTVAAHLAFGQLVAVTLGGLI